jgi:hypothetical protein
MCLFCSSPSQEKLRELTKLNCSYCENLQRIPVLPNLEWLECHYCLNLQGISALPKLDTLICSNNPNLQSIGALPKLEWLQCTDCPLLLSVPAASFANNVEGCPWLPSQEREETMLPHVRRLQKWFKQCGSERRTRKFQRFVDRMRSVHEELRGRGSP